MEELDGSLEREEAREILAELDQNMQTIENNCGRASRIVQDALRLGQERESILEEVEVNPLVQDHVRHALATARQKYAGSPEPKIVEHLNNSPSA